MKKSSQFIHWSIADEGTLSSLIWSIYTLKTFNKLMYVQVHCY